MTIKQVSNLFDKVADKQLSLVGVALDNPYIDPMTNIEPAVVLSAEEGRSILTFTFSPVGAQYTQLKQFNLAVAETRAGVPAVSVEPAVVEPDAVPLLNHQRNTVSIGVFFDDADGEVSSMNINSIKFHKAVLKQKVADTTLTATLLFREKTSDSSSFFAGFVDKALRPSTGVKVLQLLGERLVGVPVSYATSASNAMSSSILPVSSPLAVKVEDTKLTVANDSATLSLDLNAVQDVHILHTREDEYLVTVKAPKTVVVIALHY